MSKILVNINNLSEINEYKKIGITNFLFAIPEFSIGYNTINIEDIPDNSYILINRVMDSKTIDNLKKIKDQLLRFKGIIFEDIGVFNIFNNQDIELIWFQNHFTTNHASINAWLDNGCASSIISNEITENEILEIINKAHKPLILNVLGCNQIMYSRRTLLSNFNNYNNLKKYNDMTLKEPTTGNTFLAKESEYGTIIYNHEYFNYTPLMKKVPDDKIKFYLILNIDLSVDKVNAILEGEQFGNDGFLNKKTVYRMSEYNDR